MILTRSHIKPSVRLYSKLVSQHIFTKKLENPKQLPVSSIPTHKLLQDLGYVNQPSAGTVHWLPLGLRVLRKVEAIIRRRMDEIGGEEFELSSISSKKLWEKSGRWSNTELFKMKINDKDKEDFCLAPTHEEEITELIKNAGPNYKSLPLLTYQISRKYRFEKRPRGGLLRGREFIMKDAYSFDADQKSSMEMFHKVNDAYYKIFSDLKVPFVRAEADSGDIGGNLSQEWHYVHKSGEDLLFKCDHCDYVSNVEKTISYPEEGEYALNASVKYALTKDGESLISAYFPNDREFVPNFLQNCIEDVDLSTLNEDPKKLIEDFTKNEDDLIWKKFIRIMDLRVNDRTDLPDFPVSTFQKNNFSLITDIPLVEAVEGEYCSECLEGKLHGINAIEVGHTFYLGTRYSTPMKAFFATSDNKMAPYEMGCYGIGVSRIIAGIAELTRDEEGLVWPSSISPYQICLIESPQNDPQNTEDVKGKLSELSIMEDLRPSKKFGFGAKMNNARMHGIPIIMVLGKNWPLVELEIRGKRWEEKSKYAYEELLELKGAEFQWRVEAPRNGVEKHFVHKDHVLEVVKSLLVDL